MHNEINQTGYLSQDFEDLRKKFGVSKDKLNEAIQKVGDSKEALLLYFGCGDTPQMNIGQGQSPTDLNPSL